MAICSRAFALAIAALACVAGATPLLAGPDDTTGSLPSAAAAASEHYFVEFRAIEDPLYGHSYIAYGRLDGSGGHAATQYADFYPKDAPTGNALVYSGPAKTHPTRDMLRRKVVSVSRHTLSAQQFRRLTAAIAHARASHATWSMLGYNCNAFVADAAKAIGLQAPGPTMPAIDFIASLRDMNGPSTTGRGQRR